MAQRGEQTQNNSIPRRWFALGLGGLLFILVFALSPSPMQAACKEWYVAGKWAMQQSNGALTRLELRQDGTRVTGTAADSGLGNVTGNILGNDFYLEIVWYQEGKTGIYRGKVASNGRMDGTGYEKRSPGVKVTWFSTESMRCNDVKAPVYQQSGAPKPATGSLGSVQAGAAAAAEAKAAQSKAAAAQAEQIKAAAAQAAQKSSISANPQVVEIPDGEEEGFTTLTWNAGSGHPNAQLRVQVNNRDEKVVAQQAKGSRQVRVKAGKTYQYTVTDSGQELASVTVSAGRSSSDEPRKKRKRKQQDQD